MHILIIPSWYKIAQNLFYGTFFEEQARMLQKGGHKVGVLYPYHIPSFLQITKKENDLIDNNIPTFYSTTSSILPTRYGDWLNIKWIIRNAIKKYNEYVEGYGKPDIIHAHSVFYGGICAKEIFKKYGVQYVLTEHLTSFIETNEFDRFPYLKYIYTTYINVSKLIFVSEFFKNKMEVKYLLDKNKTQTIHNVVNEIFFNSSQVKDSFVFKILNIGGLIKRKNQEVLLKALKYLSEKYNFLFELTIIGKGPLENELKILTQELGFNDNVNFISKCSRFEIKKHIQKSHVLVSTSLFETFGLNIAEAHAVGRPTVVYNSGGPAEFVNTKNGILVEENSFQKIAFAIYNIYQNYNKYNSKVISEECRLKFSESVILEKLEDVYNNILSEK